MGQAVGPYHVYYGYIHAYELWLHRGFVSSFGPLKDMTINYGEIKGAPVMTNETDNITNVFADIILNSGDHTDLCSTAEAATML